MEIRQDIIIDEEIYVKFCTKSLVIKSLRTTIITSILLLFVMTWLSAKNQPDIDIVPVIGANAFMVFCYAIVVTVLNYFMTKKAARRNYHKMKMNEMTIAVKCNEEGLTQSVGEESITYSWNQFLKIKEDDVSFLFFIAQTQALVLPKKCFSDYDVEEIKNLIKTNANPKIVRLK